MISIHRTGQLAFGNEAQIIANVLQDCADPEHHIYYLEEMVDAIAGKETYIDIFKRDDNDDGISNLIEKQLRCGATLR